MSSSALVGTSFKHPLCKGGPLHTIQLHKAALAKTTSYAKEDLCIPYNYTKRHQHQLKHTLCKGGPLHTITCIPLLAYHYFYVQYNYETVKLTISDNHQELMQKPWCADVPICTKRHQFYTYPIEIESGITFINFSIINFMSKSLNYELRDN